MANRVYNNKGKVHPSPDHHLSLFLPATIFALTASLPIHDKEVLAYFLSCSDSGCGVDIVASRSSTRRKAYHAPQFECSCFGCYISFWSRWDSSNNCHVIDKIIEAFEEGERRAATHGKVRQGKRGRREWKKRGGGGGEGDSGKGTAVTRVETTVEERSSSEEEEEVVRGVVGRIGTTIGYKIWNFLDRITM